MKKRLISALLVLVLFATLVTPTAMASVPAADELRVLAEGGATRLEFAQRVFDMTDDLKEINDISNGAIRDIPYNADYKADIYALFRAGILIPTDKFNSFEPNRKITLDEADGIIFRARNPLARRLLNLGKAFSGEDIFELTEAAVFTIEVFNRNGDSIRNGSAFFISADGYAVTCLHVLNDAVTATAKLSDGTTPVIEGVAAYNEDTNIAILKLRGSDFTWLPVINSDTVKVGATAYSLGVPFELMGTFSKGMVSYQNRIDVTGREVIQFTASISSGSGGGALLDAQGRVIGVTSSGYIGNGHLNFAEPSKHILSLRIGELKTLSELR